MVAALSFAPEQVLWRPQPGPQTLLLQLPPDIRDVFYGGARGGGKTDGMLGHWMAHEARYGGLAQGIFFRRTYKQLDRVLQRARQLFRPLGAVFKESKDSYQWVFPSGATLKLRHLKTVADADEYQGHEYNWMCFEELPQWPDPTPVDLLFGALRDSHGVPCFRLATGNPGGAGHIWVRERYIDAAPAYTPYQVKDWDGNVIRDANGRAQIGVFIPARITDNPALLENDPNYIANLRQTGPAWLVRAWLEGDWNVVAGGFLEGVWRQDRHVTKAFMPPKDWSRWRAMDWGFGAPYSIGWYAMNPANNVIVRYRERYGWGGKPNTGTREEATDVAEMIKQVEAQEIKDGCRFMRNPADHDIWGERGGGKNIYSLFRGKGVRWAKARKGPGSRKAGAQVVIHYLKHELFQVTDNCRHFLRTVPVIPTDPDDPEMVDTEAEDHAWDELRYSLTSRHRALDSGDSKPKPQKKPKIEPRRPGATDPRGRLAESKRAPATRPFPIRTRRTANHGG